MIAARARDRLDVAVGGAVGAWLRAGLLALAAVASGHPAGPLVAIVVANLAGTYLLGWVGGRGEHDRRWAARAALLGTGLAGALTTFSGLAVQLARLGEVIGAPAVAVVAVAHLVVGIGVVRVGLRHGRRAAGGAR